eukprot:11177356-Lingulodinium_polyedra.AAC.2
MSTLEAWLGRRWRRPASAVFMWLPALAYGAISPNHGSAMHRCTEAELQLGFNWQAGPCNPCNVNKWIPTQRLDVTNSPPSTSAPGRYVGARACACAVFFRAAQVWFVGSGVFGSAVLGSGSAGLFFQSVSCAQNQQSSKQPADQSRSIGLPTNHRPICRAWISMVVCPGRLWIRPVLFSASPSPYSFWCYLLFPAALPSPSLPPSRVAFSVASLSLSLSLSLPVSVCVLTNRDA